MDPNHNNARNIVKMISDKVDNGPGTEGFAAFTTLIYEEDLNDGSKARIQDEVKEQMTSFFGE